MQRRTKIIIAVIVLILLALIAMLFLLKPPAAAPAPQPAPQPAANANVNKPAAQTGGNKPVANVNVGGNVNAAAAAQVDDRTSLKNTARSFAELFGSSSTEGNYQNIVDAEYYMTASVKAWAEKYVADQRALPKTGEFSGTTTRAIFDPDVTAYDKDAGTATVTVKTRRIETGSTIGSQNVYYQDLTLEFVKEGTAWKVNRFTWEPK